MKTPTLTQNAHTHETYRYVTVGLEARYWSLELRHQRGPHTEGVGTLYLQVGGPPGGAPATQVSFQQVELADLRRLAQALVEACDLELEAQAPAPVAPARPLPEWVGDALRCLQPAQAA